jgi:hypothetical protein
MNLLPKPKAFKRLRKVKAWTTLPNMQGRRGDDPGLPLLPKGFRERFDLTDDRVDRLAYVLNDERLAQRVIDMQDGDYPYGTVPEMIMLDFLQAKGERYKFQAQLYGGWRRGGLVPDFVVSRGGRARALLINGIYWHNIPGKKQKDVADKLRIVNQYFDGDLITDATIIWETRIVDDPERERNMQLALEGIELPA